VSRSRTTAAFTLLVPLRRNAQTTGIAAAPLQQSKKSICGCVPLEKPPPQLNLQILSLRAPNLTPSCVSLSLQVLFPKSKFNKKLEEVSAVDSCPWEFLFFI